MSAFSHKGRLAVILAATFGSLANSCAGWTGFPASQSGEQQTYVSFQDPFEQSFTVEVPQGWKVRGGLFRMGYSDERPMIDLLSPDGLINVRLGDISIPTYTSPIPYHSQEGAVYDLGAQAQLIVARYRTGPEFAVLYSHVRFYKDCQNGSGDSGDIGFSIPDYIPQQGSTSTGSSGGIAYRCGVGANQRVAFAYAKTVQAGALWGVPTMGTFLSPPSQTSVAKAVLLHCAQTFRLSPAWIEKQKQMDAFAMQYQQARQQQRRMQIAQQVRQFEAQMQAMRNQVAAFEAHQSAQANQVNGFLDALNGVTPTIDPFTGNAREVWTGKTSNYWQNGAGDVVNSVNPPPGNWRQMQVLQR